MSQVFKLEMGHACIRIEWLQGGHKLILVQFKSYQVMPETGLAIFYIRSNLCSSVPALSTLEGSIVYIIRSNAPE